MPVVAFLMAISAGSKPFGISSTRAPGCRRRRSAGRLRRHGDDRGRVAHNPRLELCAARARRGRRPDSRPRGRAARRRAGTPSTARCEARSEANGGAVASTASYLSPRRRCLISRAPRGIQSVESGSASGRRPASRKSGSARRPAVSITRARACALRGAAYSSPPPAETTSTSQPCSGRWRANERQRAAGPPAWSIGRCETSRSRFTSRISSHGSASI